MGLFATLGVFAYLDDVLVLCVSAELCSKVVLAVQFALFDSQLVILEKSCIVPVQVFTWVGKMFDLRNRSVSNIPGSWAGCWQWCFGFILGFVFEAS